MLNAGTLTLNVYELNYRQQIPQGSFGFGYGFSKQAVEPLLKGSGNLNSDVAMMALSIEDYGYMYLGDRAIPTGGTPYNGTEFMTFALNSGPSTGALSDASLSHAQCTFYNLYPFGAVSGSQPEYPFQPSVIYTHEANEDGDDGHLDGSLAPGPCPYKQNLTGVTGQIQPSDFVIPYVMYDYFQLYAMGGEVGKDFVDVGGGDMISVKTAYSVGYQNGAGATNRLGTFIQTSTYCPANFIPWSGWEERDKAQVSNAEWTDLPAEPGLQNVFDQDNFLGVARDFFILKGGQVFDGQPETPVIFDPVAGTYRPIQLVAQTAAAAELIAATSGMDLAYSKRMGTFYFINPSLPDYPQYIFATNYKYTPIPPVIEKPPPLTLVLPRTAVVPKINMPCYGVRAPQPKVSR